MTARISRGELAWLPIALAAILLIYLPGLGNTPVADDGYLTDGSLFADYRSSFALRARMLSYGTFVWVQALFGEGWWKQRLVNIAIHIAVVVALWALYRAILSRIEAPAAEGQHATAYSQSPALGLAIGFFALNPVAVYAVGYLIQRSILLATFFVVVGLWLFARGLIDRQWYLHVLALACYLLAVASKEYAILAPVAAIPIYIVVARPSGRRLALLAGGGALLVAAAGVALWARYGGIIGHPFDEYSRVYLAQLAKLSPDAEKNAYGLSILNQAYFFFQYGLRWFLPYEGWMSINLRPPFPIAWFTFPQVLGIFAYAATVIGGFVLVIRYRHWPALIGVSILLPSLLFGTEFATVWVQDPFVLYRSYLWAIGVPGIVFFAFHGPSWRVLLGIGLALGALLVWQSLDRVISMRTPEAVWSDAIAKLPDDPRAVGRWFPYLNRGSANVDRDRFDLAQRDFEASSALGDLGMGAVNMGSLLSAAGKHQEALGWFDKAEKEGFNLYNLPSQRGLALAALGRLDEAYRQLQLAKAMDPPSPMREIVLLNLGKVGMQLKKGDEAIADLERLLQVDPAQKEAKYLLAMEYIMKGDAARAHGLLDRLLMQESNPRAFYARALANYALKRKSEAMADIDTAIRMGPDSAHLREWQARIRAMP